MSDDDHYTVPFLYFIGDQGMRIHIMLNEFESNVYIICYDGWIFFIIISSPPPHANARSSKVAAGDHFEKENLHIDLKWREMRSSDFRSSTMAADATWELPPPP